MIDLFNIKNITKSNINESISYSFILPLIGVFFYTVNFMFFKVGHVSIPKDINNISFLFGLRIHDFELINTSCWIGMYFILFCLLSIRYSIPILKAILICSLPTCIVLLFSYLMF
jgi:hypothetical protein